VTARLTDPDLFWLWDEHHPAEAEEEPEPDLPPLPALPTIDSLPETVDYSIRGPNDWIVSGPLAPGAGRGRYFSSELEAYRWAVAKYGLARVSRVSEAGEGRWGYLIRAV